ncbi:Monocarboxylate transporter 9 [Frankliniella fusca]|uniref:Monocarboxylate transporter 9 n=1 Tax=Frankliniella fusca TaxID=407009 RepID=A0AAE1HKW3_9NEOP|nr:Monocarboxylate transporter 9 [Frankliniella fusca]
MINDDCLESASGYSSTRLAAELRQLLTLKQHYYPEGGWGWVVLWTGALGQLLGPGLQGAAGVLGQEADRRFGVSHSAGREGGRERNALVAEVKTGLPVASCICKL